MSANAADEEKKLSKMAEEREDDKGSVKSAKAPEDNSASKADSTGTGADKKPEATEMDETKNQSKKTDEKSGDDESKADGSSKVDGVDGKAEGTTGRDNGSADKPKAPVEPEAKGKNRNGAKKPADDEDADDVDDEYQPSGKRLGSIALIDSNITKAKVEDLQTLHTVLYDETAKTMVLRRNLRKFGGFDFKPSSAAYRSRVLNTGKLDVKKLVQVAEILALEKKGSKEELVERICTFLQKPDGDEELPEEMGEEEEEEDKEEDEEMSEEEEAPKKKTPSKRGAVPARGRDSAKSTSGRPKRSTAGRGYQDNSLYVDYSTSEQEEEETVKVGRGRRARRGSDSGSDYNPSAGSDSDAGKRRSSRAPARGSRTSARNVRKRYSDDESEESASDDDFSEDDRRKKKTTPARGRGRPSTAAGSRQSLRGRGRKRKAETESEEEESEPEIDSDDSDQPKRKSVTKSSGRGSVAGANNNAKNSSPAKGRGQPRRAAAVNSAKKSRRGGRGRSSSGDDDEEEDEEDEEEEEEPELDDNESEDEKPLVKKAKQDKESDAAAPPSEDDIKEYLKEILEEANLEEITMKTVCKKVYAKYPEHDLSHKKDFIKATVKSLIST
ncbi:protein DEK isoform X2 [Anopheles funestus]|uniref:protein DEK isoform X2 n=1 Tax=Anopheles funestus TaxID=62324 RepID=UPI0020C6F96A|nr:protein DEK isoform X2 [Anopheles funestus]